MDIKALLIKFQKIFKSSIQFLKKQFRDKSWVIVVVYIMCLYYSNKIFATIKSKIYLNKKNKTLIVNSDSVSIFHIKFNSYNHMGYSDKNYKVNINLL